MFFFALLFVILISLRNSIRPGSFTITHTTRNIHKINQKTSIMIVSIPKIRIIVPTLHYHMFLRLKPFRSDEYKYAKRKRTIFNLVLSPFP